MEFITVANCFNPSEADVLASALRASGFNVLLHGENAARVTAAPFSVGGVRVQVPADQADAARAVLDQIRKENGIGEEAASDNGPDGNGEGAAGASRA